MKTGTDAWRFRTHPLGIFKSPGAARKDNSAWVLLPPMGRAADFLPLCRPSLEELGGAQGPFSRQTYPRTILPDSIRELLSPLWGVFGEGLDQGLSPFWYRHFVCEEDVFGIRLLAI